MACSTTLNDRKIVCIGLICLDMVHTCQDYPPEDSDYRSVDYKWQRGGNASNTCTVLSLLGSKCEFFGVISKEKHKSFLQRDLKKYNIDFSNCPEVENCRCPVSTIILSLSTGTRTILHHNFNLPELKLQDFCKIKLKNCSWMHFEGRNVTQVLSMMEHVYNFNQFMKSINLISSESSKEPHMNITISLELEKPEHGLLLLLPLAEIIFISKDFAQSRGYDTMDGILDHIGEKAKWGTVLICAWGDKGAMARTTDGTTVKSPAFPPEKIVDSLGAGDTFNAAIIHYLNKIKISNVKKEMETLKNSNIDSKHISCIDPDLLKEALTFACQVAGAKVGMKGYDDLLKFR
ncbi:hypothetical protein M0802_004731 [Mischocyttarus mexicanus]|nr:hypothetical protein M0802_004731 [Mischocyttarus mexicanus]